MKDALIHGVAVVSTHPKTAVVVAGITGFNQWWINWGNPVFNMVTSVLSVILVCVLINYHWHNTKKVKRENKGDE